MESRRAKWRSCIGFLFLLVIKSGEGVLSPFFFFCDYHAPGQSISSATSFKLSLSGNPTFYTPGQIYEVDAWLSTPFDGFLMTGVYSTPPSFTAPSFLLFSFPGKQSSGQLCSVVHSHIGREPNSNLTFLWMAPPANTGCVQFIATATFQGQILMKDVSVYQICEEGSLNDVNVVLAGIHEEGVIFRDDFAMRKDLDISLWSESNNLKVGDECGSVLYNSGVQLCNGSITTNVLNCTTAGVLQFALAKSPCGNHSNLLPLAETEANLTVSYGFWKNGKCVNITELQKFSPKSKDVAIHILPLPIQTRKLDVCFQLQAYGNECVGLDDVAISNADRRPTFLQANFDPFDPSKWIFFPGGTIDRTCGGSGFSLRFDSNNKKPNWATTRDLQLSSIPLADDILWKADLKTPANQGWLLQGVAPVFCQEDKLLFNIEKNNSAAFACTGFLNASLAGNLRYRLAPYFEDCFGNQSASVMSQAARIYVWLESQGEKHYLQQNVLLVRKEARSISLVIPSSAQKSQSRICWQLGRENPLFNPAWTIGQIILLPTLPSRPQHALQFSTQLDCQGNGSTNLQVSLQFSNDQGGVWSNLQTSCLPPVCLGAHMGQQTSYSSLEIDPWQRISAILPYAALSATTRIRFTQKGRLKQKGPSWAIDKVYAGQCPNSCHGKGDCQPGGICRCDLGFTGAFCEVALVRTAVSLKENFDSQSDLSKTFSKIVGGFSSLQCGIVSLDHAFVFAGEHSRLLLTRAVNTTRATQLQLTVKVGGPASTRSLCPGPDRPGERLYLHGSCNGGLTWDLIQHFGPTSGQETRQYRISIPEKLRGPSCQLRLWQPLHSGKNQDIFAIDDFYLAESLPGPLYWNSTQPTTNLHLMRPASGQWGHYCERDNVWLVSHQLEAGPIQVGPGWVLQAELSTCSGIDDGELGLEYSLDEGVIWLTLQEKYGFPYHVTALKNWTRLSVPLPRNTWGNSVRLKFTQTSFTSKELPWGLSRLYVGPSCTKYCWHRGQCTEGGCSCDETNVEGECKPSQRTPEYKTLGGNWNTSGGVHFIHAGLRSLETDDMPYSSQGRLVFTLQTLFAKEDFELELQFSENGGAEWTFWKLFTSRYFKEPNLESLEFPKHSKTSWIRFRFWQKPQLAGNHTWTLRILSLESQDNPVNLTTTSGVELLGSESLWLLPLKSDLQLSSYCGEEDVLLWGSLGEHMLLTNPILFTTDLVVQYQVRSGCNETVLGSVTLQYSLDGNSWFNLTDSHLQNLGRWTNFAVPIPESLFNRTARLRWISSNSSLPLAIAKLSIGSCPNLCSGHGFCNQTHCNCHDGFYGDDCSDGSVVNDPGIVDYLRAENLLDVWQFVDGGTVGSDCDLETALFMDQKRPRVAQTRELDLTRVITLSFRMQIGGKLPGSLPCSQATDSDSVQLFYSVHNGLVWTLWKNLSGSEFSNRQRVLLPLPAQMKTRATSIKWQQYAESEKNDQVAWSLSDVVTLKDNNPGSFEDTGKYQADSVIGTFPHPWFDVQKPALISCPDNGLYLEVLPKGDTFAETWDFEVSSSSFLQFELRFGCNLDTETLRWTRRLPKLRLQYSTDWGVSWQLLEEGCTPPKRGCAHYDLPTEYHAQHYTEWMRLTVPLHKPTWSGQTRFRWISEATATNLTTGWALRGVALGDQCPWLCSGHGACVQGVCRCDDGFSGLHCVPQFALPCELKETFDQQTYWPKIRGARSTQECVPVNGKALIFNQENSRLTETPDMDIASANYVQWTWQACTEQNVTVLFQYSTNGGITWELVKSLVASLQPETHVIALKWHPQIRTNATRFRLWQPQLSKEKEYSWALDEFLVVGGVVGLFSSTLQSDEPGDEGWLTYPGGRVEAFCTTPEDQMALVYSTSSGQNYAVTRDILVTENSVLQFQIKVGCGGQFYSHGYVVLEYSIDGGAHWALLREKNSQDSTVQDLPSIYYANAESTWQRSTYSLQSLQITGPARFRWRQERSPWPLLDPHWALDAVYIGPPCPDRCNGHGFCTENQTCVCDTNYEGDTCEKEISHSEIPMGLRENFDSEDLDGLKWKRALGGQISGGCGQLAAGTAFVFHNPAMRLLETHDLNLTQPSVLQIYIKSCVLSNTSSATILIQYSSNGGIDWQNLESLLVEYDKPPQFISIVLPTEIQALGGLTRLRFWEPEPKPDSAWAIDEIFVGGEYSAVLALSDDFRTLQDNQWLLRVGGTPGPICQSNVTALHFNGENRVAITTDIVLGEQSYVQFQLITGCQRHSQCYTVIVEYSVDMGETWKVLQQPCLYGYGTNSGKSSWQCTDYELGSVLPADLSMTLPGRRYTFDLPEVTLTNTVRLRWRDTGGVAGASWALSSVYVGDECPGACSGHGRCDFGQCLCDFPWEGDACDLTETSLPQSIKETFDRTFNSEYWQVVAGGQVSDLCPRVGPGTALHFYGACSRYVETRPLNLTTVGALQFHFQAGCLGNLTRNGNTNVVLQFSLHNEWKTLLELRIWDYNQPELVTVRLPNEARKVGTRLRLWQPIRTGHADADWAIDNFLAVPALQQSLGTFQDLQHWLRQDEMTSASSYCQYNGSLWLGKASAHHGAIMETADIPMSSKTETLVLNFALALGCGETSLAEGAVNAPVWLQGSTDGGVTWSLLREQKLRGAAGGIMSAPSVYNAPLNWTSFVYVIGSPLTSFKTLRLRWIQFPYADWAVPMTSPGLPRFALANVHLSSASCRGLCFGRGICTQGTCQCRNGYSGSDCSIVNEESPMWIKDDFNLRYVDPLHWSLIMGGEVTLPCQKLMDGLALVFSGPGLRMAVSKPVDLRISPTLQFVLLIGSENNRSSCRNPNSTSTSVYVEFSANNGLEWYLLSEYGSESYGKVIHAVLNIPEQGQTAATLIRWWQPIDQITQNATVPWALDNVYMGGSDVRAADIYDNFADSKSASHDWWLFHPQGDMAVEQCNALEDSGPTMQWPEANEEGERSLTSKPAIVVAGTMIQFKIRVGCGRIPSNCVLTEPVRLQFRTPNVNWTEVIPACLPSHNSPQCYNTDPQYPSKFTVNLYSSWTRVTYALPDMTHSAQTQFRWIQESRVNASSDLWALDDIYIGNACPQLCHGHGDCIHGKCVCDPGFEKLDCSPGREWVDALPSPWLDPFESEIEGNKWALVYGGEVNHECGNVAQGKHLYFGGCQERLAITQPFSAQEVSKMLFALRTGAMNGRKSCRAKNESTLALEKSIYLHFTTNHGVDWYLLGIYGQADYSQGRVVSLHLPVKARQAGLQLRWWQPEHGGDGWDQWALDNVEFVKESLLTERSSVQSKSWFNNFQWKVPKL